MWIKNLNRTEINLSTIIMFSLATWYPVVMYGSGPAPPPPPPAPLPAPPPASESAPSATPTGWRLPRGQDYWERALSSFHSILPSQHHQQPQPSSPTPTVLSGSPNLDSNSGKVSEKTDEDIPATHSMDTSSNTKLSTAYYQTRNTRRAHNTTQIHNIDNNTTHETTTPHIGSFDTDTGINNNFLASRTDNSNNILQNISLSFDPTDMQCTTCEKTHNITIPAPDTPITFVVSDQSIPGNLGGGGHLP